MVSNIDIKTAFGFTFTIPRIFDGKIDFFSSAYNNLIIMDDFNIQPLDSAMKNVIKVNVLFRLIKEKVFFKGQGSCIDLILTNRRFSFNPVQDGPGKQF